MTDEGSAKPADFAAIRRLFQKLQRTLASPSEALPERVVHGGLWQLIERGASRTAHFIQLVVLARLLVPEDFGLFGIALLTQQTLEVLLRFGIDAALIQREEETERYLNTAWTLKIVKAVAVSLCLLLVAPWVAAFFDAPAAAPLIRVMAAIVVVRGFNNIGVIYFQKELEFQKQFAFRFAGALANVLVAIVLAVVLGSVWALVAGMVASALVRLVISYVLHPYRPRLELEFDRARELWDYGKWLFGSTTLVYASTQGDDILLGRWLGAGALGVYQVAYRISNVVATEISNVISSVTFPAYAKLQSAADKLRRSFMATFALTALIVVPLTGAIALFIPEFVNYVIGDQWEEAIGPVRILAGAGLLRAISACWGPLYRAQARTEKPFWKQALRVMLTLGPAYPLTELYGINGMALCVLLGIGGALTYDLLWAGTKGAVGVGVRDVVRELIGPVAATLATVGILLMLGTEIEQGLSSFVGLAVCYVVIYGVCIMVLEKMGWNTGVAQMVALLDRIE